MKLKVYGVHTCNLENDVSAEQDFVKCHTIGL